MGGVLQAGAVMVFPRGCGWGSLRPGRCMAGAGDGGSGLVLVVGFFGVGSVIGGGGIRAGAGTGSSVMVVQGGVFWVFGDGCSGWGVGGVRGGGGGWGFGVLGWVGCPPVGCPRWGEWVSVCRSVGLMVCQVWLLACFLVVCQVVVGLWWVLCVHPVGLLGSHLRYFRYDSYWGCQYVRLRSAVRSTASLRQEVVT